MLLAATISGSAILAIFSVSLIGPSLGPILPTALAILRAAYPRNAGAATGIAFGSCNFGGGLVPPLLGIAISQVGSASAIGAILIIALVMSAFLVAIAVTQRNRIAHRRIFSSNRTACS